MKNTKISYILVATLVFAVAFASCTKSEKPESEEPESEKTKTVTVAEQSGMLTASEVETVIFAVTTENITDGDYDAQVANLPTGVTVQGKIAINGGKGTLTLMGSAITTANVYNNIALTIDNTTSKAFTLTVITKTYTYVISVSPTTLDFGELETLYEQPVTITNTGTGSITLTQPTAINYEIGTLTATTLAAGEKATFTVRPKAGLAEGATGIFKFSETITINGTDIKSATVTVSFMVCNPTYIIEAGTQILQFGSLPFGYTQPTAQTVVIRNFGSETVTLNPLPTVDNYTLTALSKTNLGGYGASATFTVRPNAGLTAGTYNREITITGTGGATVTIFVLFTVAGNMGE